ncbi:MAG: hypothetical protein HY711_00160, partial [Candidatus Melainabacteria bacterium]|nr:hypothetical protein [Candidatus Melainabacteria bacterium]
MLIRWLGSEIRIFGFFKNLILMAAFLGLGLGCATASNLKGKSGKLSNLFPVLIFFNVLVLTLAPHIGLTNMTFVLSLDLFDWNTGIPSVTALAINILSLSAVFLLVTATFDALGQDLGRELAVGAPLNAYTLNLLGSLAGVMVYSLLCFLETPPWIWLGVGFLVVLCFYHRPWQLGLFFVSLAFAYLASSGSIWSPYYRIDLHPVLLPDFHETQPVPAGTFLEVNHMVHQRALNLSDQFLDKHPKLRSSVEYNTYNLPYEAVPHPSAVLVLGAGTGNDVAAALRHGAQKVDAVEIDPTILKLGHKLHPEGPYQDTRVNIHNNDARAYLTSTNNKYNLIVFGHVDSHTTFSTVSSVRLDNYLYTRESLRSATNHLAPQGIAALSFAAGPLWLRARLYQLVKDVADSPPIVFSTHFDNPGSILILWGPGLDSVRGNLERTRFKQLIAPKELCQPISIPTDDWPFLYQRLRNLPLIYVFV